MDNLKCRQVSYINFPKAFFMLNKKSSFFRQVDHNSQFCLAAKVVATLMVVVISINEQQNDLPTNGSFYADQSAAKVHAEHTNGNWWLILRTNNIV